MKKHLLKSALLITLLLMCLTPFLQTAQAAWQSLAWNAFREIALDTAIDVVQDLFKDKVTPEEVARLKQRVSELDSQLAAYQTQHQEGSSAAEFHTIKQMIAGLNSMVNTMANRLDSVEDQVATLEQEVAALRQTLLTLPRNMKGIAGIIDDKPTLAFKIDYVYLAGGKPGPFKPITTGSVLHSGDYYKIAFTPIEDSYVYIFQVDSANKLFRLFPMEGFGGVTVNNFNPVKGGTTYIIPAPDKSFELDAQTGPETIYFVAARQHDVVLESQYQALQLAEQQKNLVRTQQAQAQLIKTMRDSKGPKRIKADTVAGTSKTGQTDLRQNLANMCNGCVDIVTFEHQ